jgi:hypothetical protein
VKEGDAADAVVINTMEETNTTVSLEKTVKNILIIGIFCLDLIS